MLLRTPRTLARWHRRFGDRFTVRLGPFGTFVYLVDPEDIRAVFHGDDTVFHAGEANGRFLARVLGSSSVLVTDEERHQRQRRRLAGPFHGESVARLAPVMAEVAAGEVERWPVGQPFAVWPSMQAITLDVILRTVVGARDEQRLVEARTALTALVQIDLLRMLQFARPSLGERWPWSRYRVVEQRADALVHDEVERARSDPELGARDDVLAMLVRHREEDGSAMSPREIRDQLVTMLLAGHETTATALAWALERLVRHPVVLARAAAAAADGDDAYLDAVVTETLRVRPIISDVNRKLTREVELRGCTLPAGVAVDPAILLVQRSPKHYPDPLRFDPERFVGRRPDPMIWLPFGGGGRRCLGAAFAQTEMRVVLREVLRRVELAPSTARDERARARHITLFPHRGGRVTVVRRLPGRPAAAAGSTAPTS